MQIFLFETNRLGILENRRLGDLHAIERGVEQQSPFCFPWRP